MAEGLESLGSAWSGKAAVAALSASRSADAARLPDGSWLMRYTLLSRVMGWVFLAVFGLMAAGPAAAYIKKPGLESFRTLVFCEIVFGGLVALSVYCILAARSRIAILPWGLRFDRPLRAPITLHWPEILDISFSRTQQALLFRRQAGRRLKIYVYCMDGASRLRAALEANAPAPWARSQLADDPEFSVLVPRLSAVDPPSGPFREKPRPPR
ncbi:MAG: hypothetical protein ACT4O3_00870 [Elusimicrobiota bacterium]